MATPTPKGNLPHEFTRDDVARFMASGINAVLEQLGLAHIVEGIAVLPLGEGVYLADIVMRTCLEETTWSLSVTIPPSQEAKDVPMDCPH